MKIIIDNQIVKLFVSGVVHPFFSDGNYKMVFRWPTLLEYLGLGSLFSNLPTFDQDQPLFHACISILCANEDTEVLFHLYDRLFTENLKQIKALPEIDPSFLLQALKERDQKTSCFSPVLTAYETLLREEASYTMHDLVLYLAWDRMCVWMACLFDYQSTDPKFIRGIGVLRECLIESYQHIAQQGRTTPGIYRMLEAFLFYQMRQENLEKNTAAEWTLLSQSFQALKPQDELVDCFYIDDVGVKDEEEISYLTLDSRHRVNTRLCFAHYMMDQLKAEVPGWDYVLQSKKIVYLEK